MRKFILMALISSAILGNADTQAKEKQRNEDYSGNHSHKNIRMAVASKAFAWLSGSPADNEKLAVGKSAQFFGFVGLRYKSGRKANRGDLGRAFYQLATEQHRQWVADTAKATRPVLEQWWAERIQILRKLEQHLYIGDELSEESMGDLAENFGLYNAEVALLEAKACADIEDSLTSSQIKKLVAWRRDPELASQQAVMKPKADKASGILPTEFDNQNVAIFAKCFSYLTGSFKDREIVPLGQPAQFFGFVSLRQKSGRGAKRGTVSKQFDALLNRTQKNILQQSSWTLMNINQEFMQVRRQLMQEMDLLRVAKPRNINVERYALLAQKLGMLEVRFAIVEARAYRNLRISLSEEQLDKMMSLRAGYSLDQKSTQPLLGLARGKQLYVLCAGCHDTNNHLGPSLEGVIDRPIGSINFPYSQALSAMAAKTWSIENLNRFLKGPAKMVPGTKMEFSGLLNAQDRQALIDYLSSLQPLVRYVNKSE